MSTPIESHDVTITVSFVASPGTNTSMTVERSLVSATEGFITIAEHVPLLGEIGVYVDSTAPIGVNIWYRITGEQTLGVINLTAFIEPFPSVWLKDPGRPWADLYFDFCDTTSGHATGCGDPDPEFVWGGIGSLTMDPDAGLFPVLNSETPADVWARRKYASGSITFLTRTLDAIDRVYDLFTAGGPLLMQLPDAYGWHDHFIQPGPLQMAYGSRDQRIPLRTWTAPFEVVDRPLGPSQGTACANWCAVEAQFPTYGDFDATPGTFLDLLQGEILCPPGGTDLLRDTFGRTVAPGGWGTADSGQAWTVQQGTAADFSVNGSLGLITNTVLNAFHTVTVPWTADNANARIDFALDYTPAGAGSDIHLMARYTALTSFYDARIFIASGGAMMLTLRKMVAGVETQLTTFATGLVYAANVFYTLRLSVEGTVLSAKVWPTASAEPAAFQTTIVDTDLTGPGAVGVRTIPRTATTNPLPLTFSLDNLVVNP